MKKTKSPRKSLGVRFKILGLYHSGQDLVDCCVVVGGGWGVTFGHSEVGVRQTLESGMMIRVCPPG